MRANSSCPVKCTCGSRDLTIIEVGEWTSTFEVRGGRLDRDEGFHEPSCYVRCEVECRKCKRHWRPKQIGSRRSAIQITCITIDDEE